jgi:hypothetical protein
MQHDLCSPGCIFGRWPARDFVVDAVTIFGLDALFGVPAYGVFFDYASAELAFSMVRLSVFERFWFSILYFWQALNSSSRRRKNSGGFHGHVVLVRI